MLTPSNAGPAADDDAREHVAPVAVRAEQMRGARRHLGDAQILRVGVIGAQLLGKYRGEQQQNCKRAEHDEAALERIAAQLLNANSRFLQSCTTPSLIRGSIA